MTTLAQRWINAGFKVFLVSKGDTKKPLTPNGFKDAHQDSERAATIPDDQVGVFPNGKLLVDVDIHRKGGEWGPFDEKEIRSGAPMGVDEHGDGHYLFDMPDEEWVDLVTQGVGLFGSSLDVRCSAGYFRAKGEPPTDIPMCPPKTLTLVRKWGETKGPKSTGRTEWPEPTKTPDETRELLFRQDAGMVRDRWRARLSWIRVLCGDDGIDLAWEWSKAGVIEREFSTDLTYSAFLLNWGNTDFADHTPELCWQWLSGEFPDDLDDRHGMGGNGGPPLDDEDLAPIREPSTTTEADLAALEEWQGREDWKDIPDRQIPRRRQKGLPNPAPNTIYATDGTLMGYRLAAEAGDRIRYLVDRDQWATYSDEEGWVLDRAKKQTRITQEVKNFGKPRFYVWSRKIKQNERAPHKWENSTGHISNTSLTAQALHPVLDESARFDYDHALTGLPDGHVLAMRDAVFEDPCRKQTPEDRVLLSAAYRPNQKWRGTKWDRVLRRALPNPLEREFFQVWMGSVCLIHKKKMLLFSPGPRDTSKSVIARTLKIVLGAYAIVLNKPHMLLSPDSKGTFSEESLSMRLRDARLVCLMELGTGAGVDNTVLKRLMGGDDETGRSQGKDTSIFKTSHTPWLCMNDLPNFLISKQEDWDFITCMPLTERIPKHEQVEEFAEALAEECGSFVMGWLQEGGEKYQRHGLPPLSDRMKAAKTTCMQANPIHSFFKQYEPGMVLKTETIRLAFIQAVRKAGWLNPAERAKSGKGFVSLLKECGYSITYKANAAYVIVPPRG